jgi:hypothetical protein
MLALYLRARRGGFTEGGMAEYNGAATVCDTGNNHNIGRGERVSSICSGH